MQPFHTEDVLYIQSVSTGFIDVPGQISINIFARGCQKNCDECQNPELQVFKRDYKLDEKGFEDVLARYGMATWVCFLGGDCVYQPRGLEMVAKAAKAHGKRCCLYTGMKRDDLGFLDMSNLDLIIDGPYDKSVGGPQNPASNQACYLRQGKQLWTIVPFKELKTVLSA